jgi:hypothetical protein
MKTMRILISLAIFFSFLLIGYQTGDSLGVMAWFKPGPQTSVHLTVPGSPVYTVTVLPNGQHNILLIVADDLKSQSPRLESVWMMSYVANNTRLNFLPIYPSLAEPNEKSGDILPGLFQFSLSQGKVQLASDFQDTLRAEIPWWSSFLLLDRDALIEWVNDAPSVHQLPHAWEDSRSALLGQASLYEDICWNSSIAEPKSELKNVAQRLPDHVLSNMDRSQMLDEVEAMHEQIGRFSCEFPTMAVPGSIISD